MSERNKLDVRIGGKEYTIVSGESEEYMHKVASFVDKKMGAIMNIDSRMSTSMVAVLTAINIADEYLKLKGSEDNIIGELMQYTAELEKLRAENKQLREQQQSGTSMQKNNVPAGVAKLKSKQPQVKKTESVPMNQ